MSMDVETLYALLPEAHRIRDAAEGKPLRELLALIARELSAIEENLEQLYDDQFIETCAEWVAPYIGELIGYRTLHGVSPAIASPRAEVANTIRLRRRKGTLVMLEQLAHDVTDWPARAVEFFEQLTVAQYMNHVRLHAAATTPVRSQSAMLTVNGPFNSVAHTPEVRRPESGAGRYNIPNIGIFLWRLRAFALDDIPLTPDPNDNTGRRHRLNPLGADLRLFRHALTEPSIDHLATAADVPDPLSIRAFARQTRDATATEDAVAVSDDYGAGRSVVISRGGDDEPLRLDGPAPPEKPDERRVVLIADLRDILDNANNVIGWAHEDDIAPHQIALDPERGRVLLGVDRVAEHEEEPFVTAFRYGFSLPIGGGQYERELATAEPATPEASASGMEDLQPHLETIAGGGRLIIGDSLTYAQDPIPKAGANSKVVIAARNGSRPLIAASGNLELEIEAGATLVLDGLVISGGALFLPAAADNGQRTLVLRDCTLVPGVRLQPNGEPVAPGDPSLIVEHPNTTVQLDRCITGPLHVAANSDNTVEMKDCIVDACSPERRAYAGDAAGAFGADLECRECTFVGQVRVRVLKLASNTIFMARRGAGQPLATAPVHVQRKQEGCVRFGFVPSGSIAPRRHHCVPSPADPSALPHFTSQRYGDPGYCQLRGATSRAIRQGADDEGEIGVMHACFQPQRETNLRIRLDEYLRFGLRAGFFYAT